MNPMRTPIRPQTSLVQAPVGNHRHFGELRAIAETLDKLPEAVARVHADRVRGGVDADKGRKGMSAEEVLRVMIIKQMNEFSYEQLEFHLAHSVAYRSFCGFGIGDDSPSKSTLQRNIKLVTAETLEAINRMIVNHANCNGIEDGQTIRTDSTVIKSAIHKPTDSSLLWDCVRVLVRLMERSRTFIKFAFTDDSRKAKKTTFAISNMGSSEKRTALYDELLTITRATVESAKQIADALGGCRFDDPRKQRSACELSEEMIQIIAHACRVIDQTHRRVILNGSVPAPEKIVSIFEPHVDVIVKDRRDTLYGHKVFITTGASGLVVDILVEDGNPADSTLAVKMVERQNEIYKRVPRQAAFDGGFTSRANLEAIKKLGVEDVAFSKGRGLEVAEMVKDADVYQKLRNFRAGVEGVISFLKRSFCLDRCTWRSLASFNAFTWGSVVAANLLIVARHSLS